MPVNLPELKYNIARRIADIGTEKEEALNELISKIKEMVDDARQYIEDAKKYNLTLGDVEELLAKSMDEFDAGDYELALRDALNGRQMAIDLLKIVNPKIEAKSSREIWEHYCDVIEAKFDKIFWILDKFNELIGKYADLGEISPEVGEAIKEYNNEIRFWIGKAKSRLTVPLS